MTRTMTLIIIAVFTLTACNDESASSQGTADGSPSQAGEQEKDGVFDGYLQAVDKAKASSAAANDRQNRMDEMLGYEPGETETMTMGMTELNNKAPTDYEESEGFFGQVQAQINKAKATRDMLNNRTQAMDQLSGGGTGYVQPEDAPSYGDTAETLSYDARDAADKLNSRMRQLEMITGEEDEDWDSF